VSRAIRGGLLLAAAAAFLGLGACGKKAPLRLPDSRAAEKAPLPRARVREGLVTLEFRVPAHRAFPEREEPWVIARVLRRRDPAAEWTEVGAILEREGFAFGAPLAWTDEAQTPGTAVTYRIEFRDAMRRRRADSEPLRVAWGAIPEAPLGLTAAGSERAVALSWTAAPGVAVRFRVYRREMAGRAAEPLFAEAITASGFVDSRVEPGREYCYAVRAVLQEMGIDVEGPPSAEACTLTAGPPAPPPVPPARP
jgi:hypothetical protein